MEKKSPLDDWIGKRVVVVILIDKVIYGWLRENHPSGIVVELDNGELQFVPQFIKVELPAEVKR